MEVKELTELVNKVKLQQPGAFDLLYEKFKDQAYRTAVFLTGNKEDAQDVLQDTFVTVCLEINRLKNPEAFTAWFYRILTNNARSILKKHKRELPKEENEMQQINMKVQEDFSDMLLKQEEHKHLRRLINQMDEKYRTVIVLYYFNEFSVGDIAQIAGCSQGTVKSRLFKARKILEEKLSKQKSPSKEDISK